MVGERLPWNKLWQGCRAQDNVTAFNGRIEIPLKQSLTHKTCDRSSMVGLRFTQNSNLSQCLSKNTQFVRTSTEIAFQQVLQNSSKTFHFYNKIKTKFNHKKFTLPLNPSRQPRFRGKVNFWWSNLVLILVSKWRVLLLFRKTCWSAISVDVLTHFMFLATHGRKLLFWLERAK